MEAQAPTLSPSIARPTSTEAEGKVRLLHIPAPLHHSEAQRLCDDTLQTHKPCKSQKGYLTYRGEQSQEKKTYIT